MLASPNNIELATDDEELGSLHVLVKELLDELAASEEGIVDDDETATDETGGGLELVTGAELGFTLLDPPPPPPQAARNPVNVMPIRNLERGTFGRFINHSLYLSDLINDATAYRYGLHLLVCAF